MKHTLLIGATLLAMASTTQAQEIATWKGFRTSAVSFTFDDNLSNQLTAAVPLFDKYGYKATFNVVTNWVGNGWSSWKNLVNNGHEVTSHTVSHTVNGDNELTQSKTTIKAQTGSECVTIAYPNCNVPTNMNLLRQTYIAGRICNGQVEGKTPQDFYKIGSIICGNTVASNNSTQGLINHLNTAKNKQGWAVYLIHEVNNGSGYSPLAASVIDGVLSYIDKNDQDHWCCTFAEAVKYIKERDAAKATLKSSSDNSLTFTLSDNLDNSIYNYPLSLRYKNPGWNKVSATQDGKAIEAYINGGYIYFDATPDAGEIVLMDDSKPSEPEEPYMGAIAIPGTLECENYDKGGNGFGYFDKDNENEGGEYRNDGVDIVTTNNGGYAIGYTTDSEWLKYTVEVKNDDTYSVEAYMSNGSTTEPKITLAVDGKDELEITGAGQGGDDWDTYAMSKKADLKLTKGEHTLVLKFNTMYTNIDYIKFTSTTPTGVSSTFIDNNKVFISQDSQFVEITAKEQIKLVKFFDITGKVSNFENSNKVDKNKLHSGVYVVEVVTETARITKKLTITK